MSKFNKINPNFIIKALLETKHLKPDLKKIALENGFSENYHQFYLYWEQFKDNFIISIKLKDSKTHELFDQQKEIREYNKEIEEKTEEIFKKQEEAFIPEPSRNIPNVANVLRIFREQAKEQAKEQDSNGIAKCKCCHTFEEHSHWKCDLCNCTEFTSTIEDQNKFEE